MSDLGFGVAVCLNILEASWDTSILVTFCVRLPVQGHTSLHVLAVFKSPFAIKLDERFHLCISAAFGDEHELHQDQCTTSPSCQVEAKSRP